MRGFTRGTWVGAAGLVAVTMAAGLTACTGGGRSEDEGASGGPSRTATVAKACVGGTFSWSAVKKTDELTGVSNVESLGAGGGTLTTRLERVYTPQASVRTSGPAVSSAEVLFSLGKRIGEIESDAPTLAEAAGETWAFTDVHAKAPALGDGSIAFDGAGKYVQYAGVRAVTGDFRYVCPGGASTTGHARTWQVAMEGTVDCKESVGRSDLARQAARHSCAKGSPAARASHSG